MAKKVEEKPEVAKEEPKVDDNVEKLKVKPKIKKFSNEDNIVKVDLSQPVKKEEEDTSELSKDSQAVEGEEPVVEEVKEEKEESNTVQNEETPVLEEVTEEEVKEQVEQIAEEAEKAIAESVETGKDLPENIQKLMQFMEETGGDLNDYVRLNRDYSELDNISLLKEYYKQTKPHLDSEEIDFLMEDYFSFDEDVDDEKNIKRKKLALKEQVASAKTHLEENKTKYYEDIKYGSKLTSEQQKAIDFFNRYNKESEEQKKIAESQHNTFINKTDNVFNDKFKGFEYSVGDKKYRFNVKDVDKTKTEQSDINNFVRKFLDKKNQLLDANGYHKSLFTAMNPDAVANHFYEQGKADALKQSVAKSKNINMDPRQQHSGEVNTGGLKFKVLGDNSNDFKFKIKQK